MKGTLSEISRKSLQTQKNRKIIVKCMLDSKSRIVAVDKVKYKICCTNNSY